jgi:hypothetical protein
MREMRLNILPPQVKSLTNVTFEYFREEGEKKMMEIMNKTYTNVVLSLYLQRHYV